MTPTTSGAATAAPRPTRALAAFALALLLGLQPITTDLYLPALPALTRELQAPMAAAQLTMSAVLLAFGIAQLAWGPVADRVGRRPVLLLGLALYTLASIGAAAAPGIGWLVVWRALQGASLAAAVVVARAIVRDLYEPTEGAHVMSLALSGLGVLACVGPAVGGWAAGAFGWRGSLAIVAACGAATLAFIALRLPETLAQPNPRATAPGPLLQAWWHIVRHRTFVAWSLLSACTYGALFTFLAGSAFVYIDMLGLSPVAYGLAIASTSVAYIGGTLACRRLIARHGVQGAVRRGAPLTLAAGLVLLALVAAGVRSPWAVLLPQWLFAFAHGIHQPCSQSAVVGPFPRNAGAAAALAGFMIAVAAFVVGLWLGATLASGLLPFAASVAFCCTATALIALTLVQRL